MSPAFRNSHLIAQALCLMLFTSNCNNEVVNEQPIQTEIPESTAISKKDSITLFVDSLMKLHVEVPQVIDKRFIDTLCNKQFSQLAQQTGGAVRVVVNAQLISNEIKKIVEARSCDSADVLFMIDKTGSMEDDIDNIKKGINHVLEALKRYKGNRLAIACYGDKNADGDEWFSYRNFGTDYSGARTFINSIEVTGGDDFPESVNDAFFEVVKRGFWRSDTRRLIVLIGDAPSLLPPLSKYTLEDVMRKAKEDKISMNFYPILISPYAKEDVGTMRRMEEVKMIKAIYPNPSNGPLNMDFEKENYYTIDILSVEGALLSTTNLFGKSYSRSLDSMPDGLYIIRVTDKYKNYDIGRLVLKR